MRSVSIVIPAYNEERRLPGTLAAILSYLNSKDFAFREVVVVDDGSTDNTARLVEACTDPCVRLVRNPGNRGKGYAVRNGVLNARGAWILVTDADLSAPIADLDRLLEAAAQTGARIVIGSRALDPSLVTVHQPAAREYAGRVFNLVMHVVTGLPFKDTQCGFKLFEAEAAREIFSRQKIDGFGFDVEALFIAKLRGLPTIEVPVHWANVEGTKVSFLRGLDAFLDLLRVRLRHMRGDYR